MSSKDKYGPNTAEVKELIGKIKTITPEQTEALVVATEVFWPAAGFEMWHAAWGAARDAVYDAERDNATREVARDAASRVTNRVVKSIVTDVVWALVARDLIAEEDFNTL